MRNNRKAQFMSCFVALTLIITNLFSLNVNAETQVKRLAGQGRYETAKAVTSQWDKSEYAVLVTGADYPDALSATPLAKKYDAPILLTEKNKLNNNTLSEIKRLGVKKVFIVGGRGAVGPQVENELKKQNISIERLGGSGRYETSVEVAKKLENTEEAFIVTGTDFADALTVAPIAAKKGAPIILSPSGNVNNAVKKYLEQVSKTYVIGGTKEINEVVYKQLPSPERISGANKYERNINVINKFVDNKENVYVATGANYPDALAGSALAAKNNSYILLAEENINNSTLNFIKENRFNTVTVLGGTGVVSERIANIVKTGEFIKPTGELKVHFINVGQADSILIQQNDKTMLIDAGNNNDEKVIGDYLKSQGVSYIDYLIGTHPHEDHIGAMDYVINSFKVGKIYMPKKTTTTKTYKDVITAISNKNLKITVPKVGESFKLGEATVTILSPAKEYENINDNSIVLKVQYGSNTFLFTGDAEATAEMDMVKAKMNLTADVLKLGHHGSKTSSVPNFLNVVKPTYAVMSVGKNNNYGHPDASVMDRLKTSNIKLYRTDEQGTIVAISDGNNIKFNVNPGTYTPGKNNVKPVPKPQPANPVKPIPKPNPTPKPQPQPEQPVSNTVYVTAKGKAYHRTSTCSNMKSPIATSRAEAIANNYKPCSKCKP